MYILIYIIIYFNIYTSTHVCIYTYICIKTKRPLRAIMSVYPRPLLDRWPLYHSVFVSITSLPHSRFLFSRLCSQNFRWEVYSWTSKGCTSCVFRLLVGSTRLFGTFPTTSRRRRCRLVFEIFYRVIKSLTNKPLSN